MTRKFLFCFPLRVGNIIFGYIVILIAIATVAFHLYQLGLNVTNNYFEKDEKFRNFENLESIFGSTKDSLEKIIVLTYYLTYITIAMMLFLFAIMFTCGAYKANHCLVTTFFVYSFFHLFFSIILIVWEALSDGWIQLGLIALSDRQRHLLIEKTRGLITRLTQDGLAISDLYRVFGSVPDSLSVQRQISDGSNPDRKHLQPARRSLL